jgi:glutathione-independent formaldehyde dehydrogenase
MSESDDPRHAWPANRGRAARLRPRVRPEGQADDLAKHGEIVFDQGLFWFKSQKIGTGQANVRHYNRQLRDLAGTGRATPSWIVSHDGVALQRAPEAYQHFDARDDG